MNLKEYFESVDRGDYQRENFDDFLKKVSFKYDVLSIHIAGTNGKTVVASILNNVYKAANYKTGLFISSSSKRTGLTQPAHWAGTFLTRRTPAGHSFSACTGSRTLLISCRIIFIT